MAANGRRLIVVSNRGPVVYGRDEQGRRTARRGGGGLVTALGSLAAHDDVTWIASAISDEDRRVAAEAPQGLEDQARDGSPYRLRLVSHDAGSYWRFYNVVANPMLWFIQHRLWNLVRAPSLDEDFREAWDAGYAVVNRGFATAVLDELDTTPDAIVFFHDYHLYLAPRLVRSARPDAALAHFVHIPWAGPDAWSILPRDMRWAVHDGLLANDLVGFHTQRWRRTFVDAAVGILGAERHGAAIEYEGRQTLTVAAPISVDTGEFDGLARDPAVLSLQAEIQSIRSDHLIVRVDRTDPSKNVVRGFRAFELLLERHPDLRGTTRMLALLDPSRQDIPEYEEYAAEIVRTAEEVNSRLGGGGPPPIDLRIADDFLLSVAAYKEFDVLLVNAIFDGLNLVAKEGPLVNERGGVLVLSENAGAYEELGEWALGVNPFDVGEQAEALYRALTMPQDERQSRLEAIRAQVREHDLESWVNGLLSPLDRLVSRSPG